MPVNTDTSMPWWFRHRFPLGAIVLVLSIWLTYWPSLNIIPLADHLNYLVDTFGHYDTLDILKHSYSYNRTRVLAPGDSSLYRPGMFAILAAQKGWFGSHFQYAQAFGVALHCAVAVLVYLVLLQMTDRLRLAPLTGGEQKTPTGLEAWLPLAMAMFFALNLSNAAMIVWIHINGYMVFMILVLASLSLLLWGWKRPSQTAGRRAVIALVYAWLMLGLSAFIYEIGQFLAVVFGLAASAVLWRRGKRRLAGAILGAFLLIPLLYQTCNVLDAHAQAGRYVVEHPVRDILNKSTSRDTLANAGRFSAFWMIQPFFPFETKVSCQARLIIDEPTVGQWDWNAWDYLTVGGMGLLLAGSLWGAWRLLASRARGPMLLAGLLLALIVMYSAVIVLGRMNLRPSSVVLSCNSYYAYKPLAVMLLLTGLLWSSTMERSSTGRRTWVWAGRVLVCWLVLLAAVSGQETHRANRNYARALSSGVQVVRQVNDFIDAHCKEEHFSIAFNIPKATSSFWTHGIPLTSRYFRQYENNYDPAYVLSFTSDERLIVVRGDEYRSRHPDATGALFPDIVWVATDGHIFRLGRQYVGVAYVDDGYRSVAQGPSLDEVITQMQKVVGAGKAINGASPG